MTMGSQILITDWDVVAIAATTDYKLEDYVLQENTN